MCRVSGFYEIELHNIMIFILKKKKPGTVRGGEP